jgi:hypothetical protein
MELFDQGPVGGDRRAMRLHGAALRVFANVYETRETTPTLSLLCDHAFTIGVGAPAAVVVFAGKVDAPERAIGNALCDRCFGGGGAPLQQRVFCLLPRYSDGW